MKKIWKALFLLTLGTFTFTSCEDVPEPYPVPGMNGGNKEPVAGEYLNVSFASSLGPFTSQSLSGELAWKNDFSSAMITGYQDFDGDGTKENKAGVTLLVSEPFSLAESQAAYVTFTHAINYSKTTLADDHKLLISKNYNGDAATATWEELPIKTDNTGGSFTFVNAGQTAIPAAYIGQSNVVIALKHTAHDSYSSTWEVQSIKVLEGVAQNEEEPDTPTLPEGVYVEESFETSLGAFNSMSASGELAWINDFKSAMITGYRDFDGDGTKENQPGETYLISPALDLTASKAAYVTFDHAINYSKTTIAEDHKLVISKNYNGDVAAATWEEIPFSTTNTGTSFTFVSAGKMALPAAYIGQKNVVVALKHTAHADYSSTWEVRNFQVLEGEAKEDPVIPDTPVEPGENMLVYGGFEAWSGSTPTGWKTASTAGNATLSQSTDAKSGSYAVEVAGLSSANKRLGSTEMTLSAGTYTFTVSVKAATSEGGSFSLGYVPVVDGKVDTYTYQKEGGKQVYYNNLSATEWTTASYTFTLDAETTVSLLVMNAKNPGKNILVDDASLTSENGSIVK